MLGGRKKDRPDGASRAKGAGKKDAIRDAVAQAEQDVASGRALVDMLCADDSLSAAAVQRIRNLAERSLSSADLAGLLAFRVEKLRQLVESGDLSAERELTGWDKLGVFATAVVQLQTATSTAGGASIRIEWGGHVPPPAPVGRADRKRDAKVGDIVDAE